MNKLWRRWMAAGALGASLAVLAGCGGTLAPSSSSAVMQEAPVAAPTAAPAEGGAKPADMVPGTSGGTSSGAQQSSAATTQRLVIKNAEISLQVESVEQAEAQLRAKVLELGGYIVSAQTEGSDEDMRVKVSFRVPADRFDTALGGLEGLAKKVLSRTISGEDVTEEFVDLGSQLKNLEATRDRLLELLQKAEGVEDALQVNQALTDVQGQIETIQGRIKYLQQSAALSTINVYLAPVPSTPIIEGDGWQPFAVARSALRDLLAFGQGLANLAIVLAIWTPIWLPLLLVARWGWLRLRPRLSALRARSSAPPAPKLEA